MPRFTHTLKTTLLAGAGALALTSAALAAPAVGLTGNNTLVWFDTETLEVSGTVNLDGVDVLHGFDIRPADNMLYGITSDQRIVTIDWETGATTDVSTITETIPDGASAMVDFNPVADRLRFMGSDGTNLRLNVDTGETLVDGDLNFAEGDANADAADSMVVATAYINSIGTPEATAQYDIDAGLGILLQQTAPNDGVIETRGDLGVSGETYGFDIKAMAEGDNTAYLVVDSTLYTVDLESGATTELGALAGYDGFEAGLRDIAILP
ncbi:DUF4394 domain-containing protein [Arsenicitalea aurantiaca]|uniref:DUF4394 domain-containing protein n=1 Tax=Arsenicitalea aurantiaca TaxID=1783274 RepID=A0A433XEY4_9HYPH|nr:DUF4394 domain-containing protein [Arsenicitalea aurantiaca]RUT32508.1 DUF4394 domain-containing protein [Arsenicitalea aurantiaca]